MERSKLRRGARLACWGFLILVGWCAIMVTYFSAYDLVEDAYGPPYLPSKDFTAELWDKGYFHAKGTYKNDLAVTDGDELVPEAIDITCVKETNTCTIAVADLWGHALNVDVTPNDIGTWTDRQIAFVDDSSICAVSTMVIDRTTQSVNLIVRKKAVIPEYAAKSPLHPCDGTMDKNITLAGGFEVYWHLKQRFEGRYALYFHLLLFAMNALYFGGIYWYWRQRKARHT